MTARAAPFTTFARWCADQWSRIDEEHRSEPLPSGRAAAVLVTVALSLVLARFFGGSSVLLKHPQMARLLAGLPYPDLYPWLYWAGFKLVNYGLLPALCIRFVLKRRLGEHGLRFVREPKVWLLYLGMLAVVLPLTFVAAQSATFLDTYPKYRSVGQSWTQLLIWESAYAFQFLMLEFFFRGFLLFALARYIGSLAIFVMIVPYCMIHFGKPFAECVGSIVAGTVLGTVALRTGSIYGGVVVHCGVAWAMDLFALSRNGSLQRLLAG
ncbi:MAG TPA: CPBP family intramembrane glutamic endopeptidase [Polyangiaceae bacterium]|nr:CPBP family intramembrane glutamic endopeptidase [Polyangiaceae bacterium]